MRKDAKQTKQATLHHVDGYHATHGAATNYAFCGWTENRYFTSDRYIKLDEHFNRADGKPLKGYGLEIETECSTVGNATVYAEILHNVIFPHFPGNLFKLQRDGSLHGTSAEAITQVMTKEFIRNNYSSFKLMYDTYFPALGISCASSNCGMHVNISNGCFGRTTTSIETAIRKLLYVCNSHFPLFCALTNRRQNATYYCKQMTFYCMRGACETANLHNMPASHGNSCNFSHYPEGRIELRFPGGQKNYACFRNTMESIFHLIDAVKRISWAECDDVTAIFSGCNQYVFDRLNTKCREAGTISTERLAVIRETVKREDLL